MQGPVEVYSRSFSRYIKVTAYIFQSAGIPGGSIKIHIYLLSCWTHMHVR